MTDDRDSRRRDDPLHRRPDSGKGRMEPARTAAGECDSGDSWRDDPTPVEGIRRPVVVEAAAFDADVRWAEFAEIRDEVRECRKDRLARAKRRKWIFGGGAFSGSAVLGVLVWAVTQLDARADAGAEERIRRQMVVRHEVEIRALQLQLAGALAVLGIRAPVAPNP